MSETVTFDQFVDQIEKFFSRADLQIQAHLKSGEAEHGKPSCYECTEPACCTQKTWVHLFEVFPIVRRLKKEGRDTTEFREQLRDLGERMEGASPDTWFDQQVPCIFLADKRCSIYEHRPFRCRSYWVISPPEACQPPKGNIVQHVNDASLLAACIQYAREVHRILGLKETTKRILLGTLPRVLLIALEAYDSDDYKETIRRQRWPSDTSLDTWLEGENPFGLHQIRPSKDG